MDPVLVAAVARVAAGEKVNVSRVCRDCGVSRAVFYRKLDRFLEHGSAGLTPRSRAPHTHPTSTPAHVAEAVVRARKELADEGWDHGAQTIRWRLLDIAATGVHPGGGPVLERGEVPSRATIHRILLARGQITPQPRKRPHRGRRFVHPAPNAVWQIDGTTTELADRTRATVVQIIDDHSRLDIACHAAASENSQAVWQALSAGFAAYGHPACVLSDNGTAFSGKRRQWPLVETERRLARLGITTIVSSVGHPQTCGKNERAHQTLQRWLAARPTPHTLDELQTLLEAYRRGYNHRRHQALDGDTPAQRFHATEPAHPAGPAPHVAGHLTRTVSTTGVIRFSGASIGLGRHHAGATAEVFWQGDRLTVLIDDTVAASLTLDRTIRYQRTTNLSPMR
ncbi:IS481 family transposase [Actinomycetospora lemnae]|uniref:IS481 family transposase n=1 Tax=Actinomycetospora lemnae TaxID=3019891 RepID=A0ABT5T2W4_9PSEU|nr:IS481 family transposase [Actinomycetospora sp. DW7H6]MDD7969464.1 IS481 family transposase [Actinomycetospora sp. DW7H6]